MALAIQSMLLLTLFLLSHASLTLSTDADGYVAAHNAIRAAVGAHPLRWSPRLEAEATRLVQWQMAQLHEGPRLESNISAGMNIFASCTTATLNTAEEDVSFWEMGKTDYDERSGVCKADVENTCSSYRQMVWATTTELGCRRVFPSKEFCKDSGLGTFTVCLYDPPSPGRRS